MTKGDAGDSESHKDRNSPDSPFKKCHPDKIWNSDWISFLVHYFSYKNVSYHKITQCYYLSMSRRSNIYSIDFRKDTVY